MHQNNPLIIQSPPSPQTCKRCWNLL